METGTLKELNAKPGDVVEFVEWEYGPSKSGRFAYGKVYTIKKSGLGLIADSGSGYFTEDGWSNTFRIISRATTTPDLTAITTPFGLLDEVTQEALRAHGGPYEMYDGMGWKDTDVSNLGGWIVVRAKAAPIRETEYMTISNVDGMLMKGAWVETVNGRPDWSTLKVAGND